VAEDDAIELVEGVGGSGPPSDQGRTTEAAAEGQSLP
jgi:hypothetical protein